MMNHQFLWQPTPLYYVSTFFLFIGIRRRFKLGWMHLIPFALVPATLDYLKRDYYIKMQKKEYEEFRNSTKVVS